jgi:hypothetical protein
VPAAYADCGERTLWGRSRRAAVDALTPASERPVGSDGTGLHAARAYRAECPDWWCIATIAQPVSAPSVRIAQVWSVPALTARYVPVGATSGKPDAQLPPTGQRPVSPDRTRVVAVGVHSAELARRRSGPAELAVAPARQCLVGSDPAGVVTGTDGAERASRRSRLVPLV